jgi:hypothetical protein
MIEYENGSKDVFNDSGDQQTDMIKMGDSVQNVSRKVRTSASEENFYNSSGKSINEEELILRKGKIFQNNRRLSPFEVKYKLKTNYKASGLYVGGRTMCTIGTIFQIVGIVDLGMATVHIMQREDASLNFLIGAAEVGIGVIFASVGGNKKYNFGKNI